MFPSGVNDTIRADRGAIKRWYNQTIPLVTGGTSTAYTLSYSVVPTALADGMTHLVQFNAANGVAPTLNVNALGAKPLQYYAAGDWRVVPSGLIGANQVLRVAYNSSAAAYRVMRPRDDTGEVVSFAGTTAPAGTLLCVGQAVSRTDYVGLFASAQHYLRNRRRHHDLQPAGSSRPSGGRYGQHGRFGGEPTHHHDNQLSGTTLGASGGQQTPTGPNATLAVDTTSPTQNAVDFGHTHVGGSVQPTMISQRHHPGLKILLVSPLGIIAGRQVTQRAARRARPASDRLRTDHTAAGDLDDMIDARREHECYQDCENERGGMVDCGDRVKYGEAYRCRQAGNKYVKEIQRVGNGADIDGRSNSTAYGSPVRRPTSRS